MCCYPQNDAWFDERKKCECFKHPKTVPRDMETWGFQGWKITVLQLSRQSWCIQGSCVTRYGAKKEMGYGPSRKREIWTALG